MGLIIIVSYITFCRGKTQIVWLNTEGMLLFIYAQTQPAIINIINCKRGTLVFLFSVPRFITSSFYLSLSSKSHCV